MQRIKWLDLLVRENNTNAAYSNSTGGGTSETYRKYTDPVKAAVSLLHLGDGSGAVTETPVSGRAAISLLSGGLLTGREKLCGECTLYFCGMDLL